MTTTNPVFKSSFMSPNDEFNTNFGRKPVVFDIIGPDMETSVLPDYVKLVLHVNPSSMAVNYNKVIDRAQTIGGFVEFHWGEGVDTLDFNLATGGFMRLFSGLSNVTGGAGSVVSNGTRRETIAYDKYLDFLALFRNNGSVYDATGKIVFQGYVKVTFDGGIYLGVFSNFSVDESAERPYQFMLSASFTIQHEIQRFRSIMELDSENAGIELPDIFDPGHLNNEIRNQ